MQFLWDWVVTGAAPRVAAEDTLDAKPTAAENAVFHHCLNHILAASRSIAARRRREGRNAGTVEIDREKEYVTKPFLHLRFGHLRFGHLRFGHLRFTIYLVI